MPVNNFFPQQIVYADGNMPHINDIIRKMFVSFILSFKIGLISMYDLRTEDIYYFVSFLYRISCNYVYDIMIKYLILFFGSILQFFYPNNANGGRKKLNWYKHVQAMSCIEYLKWLDKCINMTTMSECL